MIRGRILLFVGLLALSLLLSMPLPLALAMSGLTGTGLSARSVTGTIWSGQMAEARIGQIAIGDVVVSLRPLPLLVGRATIDMHNVLGRGALTSLQNGFAVEDATVKLATPGLFGQIPLVGVDLTDVTIRFSSGRCERAQGRVRAMFTGDIGGLALTQGLSGAVRCKGGALLLPLISQSTMERLNLFFQGDGGYRAEFLVRSTDPAMAVKLGGAGFAPAPGGFVLRLAGKL